MEMFIGAQQKLRLCMSMGNIGLMAMRLLSLVNLIVIELGVFNRFKLLNNFKLKQKAVEIINGFFRLFFS
jgi:hypothetical protein